MAEMKNKSVEDKVKEQTKVYRQERKEYEQFMGGVDSSYVVEFCKPILELGFTHEQVLTILTTKMTVDLSVQLKEFEFEVERLKNGHNPEEEDNDEEL